MLRFKCNRILLYMINHRRSSCGAGGGVFWNMDIISHTDFIYFTLILLLSRFYVKKTIKHWYFIIFFYAKGNLERIMTNGKIWHLFVNICKICKICKKFTNRRQYKARGWFFISLNNFLSFKYCHGNITTYVLKRHLSEIWI